MAKSPIFDLFEILCVELAGHNDVQTIDEESLADDALIASLKEHFKQTEAARAFEDGVAALAEHFVVKNGIMPFTFDLPLRQFTPVDLAYIEFIAFARNHRSSGGDDSKEFEIRTLHRLRQRVTGDLRRVGVPRSRRKQHSAILNYLKELGFADNALAATDRDGGLDILWLPPLGVSPLRPLIAVQCKNGSFDESEANSSVGRLRRTLNRHGYMQGNGTMACVVFNDYIDESYNEKAAGWTFLPLGLTDLSDPANVGVDDIL